MILCVVFFFFPFLASSSRKMIVVLVSYCFRFSVSGIKCNCDEYSTLIHIWFEKIVFFFFSRAKPRWSLNNNGSNNSSSSSNFTLFNYHNVKTYGNIYYYIIQVFIYNSWCVCVCVIAQLPMCGKNSNMYISRWLTTSSNNEKNWKKFLRMVEPVIWSY